MVSRPQFTLRALLTAMLVVAAFFGGMTVQARIEERRRVEANDFFVELMQDALRKVRARK